MGVADKFLNWHCLSERAIYIGGRDMDRKNVVGHNHLAIGVGSGGLIDMMPTAKEMDNLSAIGIGFELLDVACICLLSHATHLTVGSFARKEGYRYVFSV